MSAPNPMVPEPVWGSGADGPNALGLMCWNCVAEGNYTPPSRVVIRDGYSLCLSHAVGPTAVRP